MSSSRFEHATTIPGTKQHHERPFSTVSYLQANRDHHTTLGPVIRFVQEPSVLYLNHNRVQRTKVQKGAQDTLLRRFHRPFHQRPAFTRTAIPQKHPSGTLFLLSPASQVVREKEPRPTRRPTRLATVRSLQLATATTSDTRHPATIHLPAACEHREKSRCHFIRCCARHASITSRGDGWRGEPRQGRRGGGPLGDARRCDCRCKCDRCAGTCAAGYHTGMYLIRLCILLDLFPLVRDSLSLSLPRIAFTRRHVCL